MGKLCKEAKNQLTEKSKQAKRRKLKKLFDTQIATLKDRVVPEQIVEILQNQKGAVVKKASEMNIGDGNIAFLPVIPRSYRSPYDLMAMVKNGGKAGYTYLNPTQISDVVDAPSEPYYIYDVEDGNSTRGKSPEAAEKILKQQKRSAHGCRGHGTHDSHRCALKALCVGPRLPLRVRRLGAFCLSGQRRSPEAQLDLCLLLVWPLGGRLLR